ncbi:hypothetical protein ANO11243_061740 [Dothideomycetidae sp. 11243]|nr:hypothetical protein ANO11243_061740 [fungal sp. No.11243]
MCYGSIEDTVSKLQRPRLISSSKCLVPRTISRLGKGYNATYVLFAVSTLLAAIFRQMSTTRAGYESTLAHIQKAVEILLAIDDCIVTKNAIVIIKRTLQRAQSVSQPALTPRPVPASRPANTSSEVADPNMLQDFSFMEMGINDGNGTGLDDLEWMNDYSIDATQQAAFWTEWAQKLDTLN